MTERRNLWAAVGVALFGIGLSALLAYAIALVAAKVQFQWHKPVPVGSLIAIGTGLVILIVLSVRFTVIHHHRMTLNGFVARGNDLLRATSAGQYNHHSHTQWQNDVKSWLHKKLPYYEAHFENLAAVRSFDEIFAFYKQGARTRQMDAEVAAGHERLRAQMDRLAEITVRL